MITTTVLASTTSSKKGSFRKGCSLSRMYACRESRKARHAANIDRYSARRQKRASRRSSVINSRRKNMDRPIPGHSLVLQQQLGVCYPHHEERILGVAFLQVEKKGTV